MTVFQFSEGISGLVGPERAGKDEFVYALQWALAEHPDLDKPSWAEKWTLWQVPFVILTARDSQGVEYRLQRKLTYGGKLEQSVNDHPMDTDAFEQYLKVFRSDFHSPQTATDLATLWDDSPRKGHVFLCNHLDRDLEGPALQDHIQHLRKLTARNQCIILTNNKEIMQMIDYLCGITMEEFGKSKIVKMRRT